MREHEEPNLDVIAAALRPAVEDYLRGDRGAEMDLEAIKTKGRARRAQRKKGAFARDVTLCIAPHRDSRRNPR